MTILPDLSHLTVLVTGANGFVGSRTTQRLTEQGATVLAMVRREGTAPSGDGIEEVVGDLGVPSDARAAAARADAVVHTPASADPDLAVARSVNVDATRVLAEAARDAGVDRFVHVSTTSVYGSTAGALHEDAQLAGPDDHAYAISKAEGEDVVRGIDGLDVVVLRPPTIQGWSPSSHWGERTPRQIEAGTWQHPSVPDAPMPWVHIDDFADAIVLALTHEAAVGRTYNAITGTAPWGRYVEFVRSLGEVPEDLELFAPGAEPPPARSYPSDRIRAELGWEPTRTLEDAFAEVAASR